MLLRKLCLALGFLFFYQSLLAQSGGFEKATPWSAKWSALAGSASASVEGAEAVFFNPAGLVHGSGQEVSINLSPSFSTFNGPIVPNTINPNPPQEKGTQVVSPDFGIMGKYKLNNKISIGGGVYTVGGARAEYKNIDFSPSYGMTPDQTIDIKILELSLGVGYQVNDVLSVGLGWRSTFVTADVNLWSVDGSNNLVALHLKELSSEDYEGFKLGVQYLPKKDWGVGLSFRSKVDFKVKGNFASEVCTLGCVPLGVVAGSSGALLAENSFPEKWSIDYFKKINPHWQTFLGLSSAKYSDNKSFKLTPGVSGVSSIPQSWKDKITYKCAVEYSGIEEWIFRGGYASASPVTASHLASASFAPPGRSYYFAFGAGKSFNQYTLEATIEYGFASEQNKTAYYGSTGDFDTNTFAIHTSVKVPL